MEKEQIIELFSTINNVKDDRETLYTVMSELGIPFKKTKCVKCLKDYYNIVREELGLIEDASEVSDFNDDTSDYVFIADRPQTWKGYLMDENTPPGIISEFLKKHPEGYYRKNIQ